MRFPASTIAKLVREDGTEGASMIPFIVRDDSSTSNIVFQTSDTTWQAYNAWGGASLYFGEVPVDPDDMIGYLPPNCGCGLNCDRPRHGGQLQPPHSSPTRAPIGGTHDFIFGAEHSAIRWLEQNGYDVSYISGVDTTRSGSLLLNHDAFLSVGHDEYWSAEQRTNVEAARDAGVNLAFWSGNEVYWKVRWETSIDGNGTPYRTMVMLQGDLGRNTGSERYWNRHMARPALCRSRAGAGELADRHDVHGGQLPARTRSPSPMTIPTCASGATPTSPNLQPGQTHSLVTEPARL